MKAKKKAIVCTEKVGADDRRVARMMEIYHIGSPKHQWSFRSVFIFLNELPADWLEQRPSRRSPKISHPKVGDWILEAFYADHQGDDHIDADDRAGIERPISQMTAWSLHSYNVAFWVMDVGTFCD
jgi:hypothetical protein